MCAALLAFYGFWEKLNMAYEADNPFLKHPFSPSMVRNIMKHNNMSNVVCVAVVVISPDIFNPRTIRDNSNRLLIPAQSILLSRKSFTIRSLVTDLIECTCSTTTEWAYRILASISIFSLTSSNSANKLLRKRAVSEPGQTGCISHA